MADLRPSCPQCNTLDILERRGYWSCKRCGYLGEPNYPSCLDALIERLRGMVIEQKDALDVMAQHDGPDTLHYCDPPYVRSTRTVAAHGSHGYNHEMTDEQHRAFGVFIRGLRGMVIVSGYACALYDELLGDWQQFKRASHADGARDRVEVLWLNRTAAQQQMRLIA